MKTEICKQLGINLPIFAFSHCRDVVAAVTKAGGLGVLGAAWMTTDELEMSINWVKAQVGDKPFGVDLVFPGTGGEEVEKTPTEYLDMIPAEQMDYVSRLLTQAGIPDMSERDRREFLVEYAGKMAMTNKKSREQLEVSLASSASLIVGALGVTPDWVVSAGHQAGTMVGALVGSGKHARKQREAGVDILVAQGTEAGGSVGNIASMVLWPQVVEEARGLPVLAAGGIGRGSQILAALAIGCQGVWMGSLWLGTAESDLNVEMRERLFGASSEDARLSKAMTGKQGRMLSTKYVDAWEKPDAPATLDWPMQSILGGYPFRRAERANELDYWTYSVGQIVGDMKGHTTVRSEFERMLGEYIEALENLQEVTSFEA
jgi:NAD(P)H-dependent flavin oxidoreductase YrpB (nitropropane dioxygenase family)